jgi:lysozyme
MKTDFELAWKMISYFEGFSDVPYKLPGEKYYTIGYGRTGIEVQVNSKTTRQAEELWVKERLKKWDAQIRAKLNTKLLTDYQMAVLISFSYNVGLSAFLGSSVFTAIKNGNLYLVPSKLDLWVKGADGQVLSGLVKRRGIEGLVWISGKFPKMPNP